MYKARKLIEFFIRFVALSIQMKCAKSVNKQLKLEHRAAKLERELDAVFPR